ncbi:MAG TPA: hypothetical protein VET24_11190, partial [Actinomycetota bacterium]|nr:hypothetical protein [Actinomycetota bacterium]
MKSKDDVVEQMLAVLQSAFPVGAGKGAGAGRLAGFDLSPLKALAGGTDLSALADVDALKGLVTQALKVAGPALGGLAGSGSGSPSRAHTVSNRPAPPPVTAGRKGMPSVLGTTAAPPAAEPAAAEAPAGEVVADVVTEAAPEPRAAAKPRSFGPPRRRMPSVLGAPAPEPEAAAPEPEPEAGA